MRDLRTIIVASHNVGKIKEIRDLLTPLGVHILSAPDLDLPEPEETGLTFAANAQLKAVSAAQIGGYPALSDDSGLAVDVLDGAPGIYSARWAQIPAIEGGGRDFDMAMWHVHNAMSAKGGAKTARFVCALCLSYPDGESQVYEGQVEGDIVWPPRGDRGFGYDSIFQATGSDLTFAQIDPADKHAISHRADAFRKFMTAHFPHV